MKRLAAPSLFLTGAVCLSGVAFAQAPPPPSSTLTIGETSVLPDPDSGNGDLLVAQQTALAQAATLQSLSFYVETAAGKLRLGVYDATGPGGGPGAKKAETVEITPTAGWNTANVTASITLPAGTYWLAYFPSDSGLSFRKQMTGAGRWFSRPYGPMPATFSTTPGGDTVHWSLFATLTTSSSPPPPHPPPTVPPSLKGVAVPLPKDLDAFVKSRAWAIVLGKALFWDSDVGSDKQACASCHFHAGADDRIKNQFNPGFPITADFTFGDGSGLTGSRATAGPNYTAVAGDFPLHRLSDPEDRQSAVLYDTNDRFSSQGTFNGAFVSTPILPLLGTDKCVTPDAATNPFHVGAVFVRKVEPRNTPTMINAGFFFRNFWDGRADNIFNGVNPFGRRDPDAGVWVQVPPALPLMPPTVEKVRVELENASLASQAVGPPLSDFEMSCAGRTFSNLGRKMLPRRALASQAVHAQDSVLGPYVLPPTGLGFTYQQLVQNAFQDKYWAATTPVSGTFTQMEANFSLFWGLSIMLYEATLVSDEAPFDKFRGDATTPPSPNALTDQQKRGLDVFMTKGKCIACHKGPEFSGAATHLQPENQEEGLVERMLMGDERVALYDNGFYNIGVRPTKDDPGVGGRDPFGNPLSFTEQYIDMLRGRYVPDPFQVNACTFAVPFTVDFPLTSLTSPDCRGVPFKPADIDGLRTAVMGSFKTPSLRNVALTGPYFHNGGQATLGQVVAFYNRGGDRIDVPGGDSTGVPSNLDADIQRLFLTRQEQLDLVAFLESLTDRRVQCDQAPFDHPSLLIPNGHPVDQFTVVPDPASLGTKALDSFRLIPAVGRAGLPGILQPCVGTFADQLGLAQTDGVTGQ